MRRLLLPSSAIAVAAALVALLVFAIAGKGASDTIEAQLAHGVQPVAPDAHTILPVLDSSRRVSLAGLQGKVIVLNIFASWCTPCRAEAPILERTQRQIAGRNASVVGVTYLDNSVDSEQFVRQEHISYLVLRDVSGNFVSAFGTDAVPETFVINRAGRVTAVSRGPVDSEWLRSALRPLLGHSV